MSKTIILMRHGQPKMAARERISMFEMKDWIEQYNRSEIIRHPPSGSGRQPATRRSRHPGCFKQRASCADLGRGARAEACCRRRAFLRSATALWPLATAPAIAVYLGIYLPGLMAVRLLTQYRIRWRRKVARQHGRSTTAVPRR